MVIGQFVENGQFSSVQLCRSVRPFNLCERYCCRLGRTERGGDYDDHVLPGEAVLLNGGNGVQSTYAVTTSATAMNTGCQKPAPLLTPKDDTATMASLYATHVGVPLRHGCYYDLDPVDCATCAGDTVTTCYSVGTDDCSEVCSFAVSSLYTAHGGLPPHRGCRRWHVVDPVDCATCAGDSVTHASSCTSADDSEVCFTEELVRRKLLLGRTCPSSHYDRLPATPMSNAEVVMRTFKGLSQPPPPAAAAQSTVPCPPASVY